MSSHVVFRGVLLVLAALVAGLLIAGSFVFRAEISTRTATTICDKIHRLDAALQQIVAASASPVALARVEYYRLHPDEMARVMRAAKRELEILRDADCYADTTSTGGLK